MANLNGREGKGREGKEREGKGEEGKGRLDDHFSFAPRGKNSFFP